MVQVFKYSETWYVFYSAHPLAFVLCVLHNLSTHLPISLNNYQSTFYSVPFKVTGISYFPPNVFV
jgi:hypothetical protein